MGENEGPENRGRRELRMPSEIVPQLAQMDCSKENEKKRHKKGREDKHQPFQIEVRPKKEMELYTLIGTFVLQRSNISMWEHTQLCAWGGRKTKALGLISRK